MGSKAPQEPPKGSKKPPYASPPPPPKAPEAVIFREDQHPPKNDTQEKAVEYMKEWDNAPLSMYGPPGIGKTPFKREYAVFDAAGFSTLGLQEYLNLRAEEDWNLNLIFGTRFIFSRERTNAQAEVKS